MNPYTEVTVLYEGTLDYEETIHPTDATCRVRYLAAKSQHLPGEVEIYTLTHDHDEGVECECAQYVQDHRPVFSKGETMHHRQLVERIATLSANMKSMLAAGVRNGAFTPSMPWHGDQDGTIDHASRNNRACYRDGVIECERVLHGARADLDNMTIRANSLYPPVLNYADWCNARDEALEAEYRNAV